MGALELEPGDFDGDTVDDAHDCDPRDPNVQASPDPVTGVTVVGRTQAIVRWPAGEAGLVYEVAAGHVSELVADGGYDRATCIGATGGLELADPLAGPGAGEIHWYLVRAANACGPGSFGDAPLDPDPRDLLDETFPAAPCP
jgi:hypothetical protein